jgi:hypothetical protein
VGGGMVKDQEVRRGRRDHAEGAEGTVEHT